MSDEAAVLATFEEYAEAYCAKDIERQMALFDAGGDISMIGTGADELCGGRDAVRGVFERNFASATATKFEWHWRHVTLRDNCAAVAVCLTIHLIVDGNELKVPVRWTVSLVKHGTEWKWLHRHASTAATSQDQGSAYPQDS